MPNEQDTRDDVWQDLLTLEDDKVKKLTDGDSDSMLFEGWIDKAEDSIDYMRFKLDEPAKIYLTVNADKTAKYTLSRYVNGALESIKSDSLSKNKAKRVKDDDGTYYVGLSRMGLFRIGQVAPADRRGLLHRRSGQGQDPGFKLQCVSQ